MNSDSTFEYTSEPSPIRMYESGNKEMSGKNFDIATFRLLSDLLEMLNEGKTDENEEQVIRVIATHG